MFSYDMSMLRYVKFCYVMLVLVFNVKWQDAARRNTTQRDTHDRKGKDRARQHNTTSCWQTMWSNVMLFYVGFILMFVYNFGHLVKGSYVVMFKLLSMDIFMFKCMLSYVLLCYVMLVFMLCYVVFCYVW